MDWRRKAGDHDGQVDSVEHRDNRAVVAFSWSDRVGTRHMWAQVLEVRDGKVVSIQDYAKPSRAALATRLRAALSF
jgi:ketosteroid isomerase-like protein